LGFAEKITIIEYLFKKEVLNVNDFAKYWSKADYLMRKGFVSGINYGKG